MLGTVKVPNPLSLLKKGDIMFKKIKQFLIDQVVKKYLPEVLEALKKYAKEKGIEFLEKVLETLKK